MNRLIRILEAPLYLSTIGLACMELGAPNAAIFLFIVSAGRLTINVIRDKK